MKDLFRLIGLMSALLIWSAQAYAAGDLAGSVSHPLFPLDVAPRATMKFPPVSSLRMGEFVVHLGSTDLTKIPETIKAGKISQTGDAAECTEALCYSVTNPTDPFRIWLFSNCEMDEGKVGEIAVTEMNLDNHLTPSCPELPAVFLPARFDNLIWLRTPESEVLTKLGMPSLKKENWLHYQSARELTKEDDPKLVGWFDVGSFSAKFRNGRIIEMWASRGISDSL